MDILLLGPPGAGKGTQGDRLADALNVPRFATGDLLRDAVARQTPLGQKARVVMEAGHLVSDELILGIIAEELRKPAAAGGVVLDGVVRTIPQAEGVERILEPMHRRVDRVVFFEISDALLQERLASRRQVEHRADDDPDAVINRLAAYRAQTAPVLDWYEHRGGVRRIDAVGSIDEVARRIMPALELA